MPCDAREVHGVLALDSLEVDIALRDLACCATGTSGRSSGALSSAGSLRHLRTYLVLVIESKSVASMAACDSVWILQK